MSSIDIRQLLSAASAAAPGAAGDHLAAPIKTLVRPRVRLSPVVVAGAVRGCEALLVAATGLIVHAAYVAPVAPLEWTQLVAIAGITALTSLAVQSIGAYSIGALRTFFGTGLKVAGAWTMVFLIALALIFFAKMGDQISRVWLGAWYLAGLVVLLTERCALSLWVAGRARAGVFDRRTAIVGGGDAANEIIRALQAQAHTGIRIVGVYDDRDDDRSPKLVSGYEKLGKVSDLVEHARRTPIDLVIFTVPISAENRLLQMLGKLWVLPIDIRLSAHSSKLRLRPRSYSYIGDVPVLDVFDRPLADWDHVLKWLFDKVVGSVLLVLCLPILLAAAIAVKLDSRGPILFRQKRYGFNNELVEVLKFRSMHIDQTDQAAAKLVTRGDPRVTRVGRFLRKSSIDELPQLVNVVFKGNLSLVGPRPHALQAKAEEQLYEQVVDSYFARHRVKPGITGWAQINGWRGETDTHEKLQRRVEHDLYYIENWSVFFDMYIVLATPFSLLKHDTAY